MERILLYMTQQKVTQKIICGNNSVNIATTRYSGSNWFSFWYNFICVYHIHGNSLVKPLQINQLLRLFFMHQMHILSSFFSHSTYLLYKEIINMMSFFFHFPNEYGLAYVLILALRHIIKPWIWHMCQLFFETLVFYLN